MRTGKIRRGLLRALQVATLGGVAGLAHAADVTAPACLIGIYRSEDGAGLAVSLVPGRADAVRASRLDGRSGLFVRSGDDEFTASTASDNPRALVGRLSAPQCDGSIALRMVGDRDERWTRVPLRVTRTRFESQATVLAGQLIEPPAVEGKPPLFVNVHGSEATAAVDSSSIPLLMALEGIASFVFDKRGTGASGGSYTQDFDVLADDVAAAVVTARRLAGDRVGRVGVAGFSQGGWVAPAAATKTPVDFVVVAFGVAGTPVEQDAWQVAYELRAAGFGEADVADAGVVTEITGRVAASGFDCDRALLDRVAARYGARDWYRRIEGQYSGLVLRGECVRARDESPAVAWRYDWRAPLERLRIPQIWVLAGDDSVAPSQPTVERLREIRRAGRPIGIVVFPETDHGIRTYRVAADGKRRTLAFAEGYLALLADWMKGVGQASYGDARFID